MAEKAVPVHGDILEEIISHVPSLNLVHASYVSKAWRRAVFSSLRHSPRRRIPWLFLHLQSRRFPSKIILTYAYDPHSHEWIRIPHHLDTTIQVDQLCFSYPGLLYTLTLSKLAFTTDTFGSTWREVDGPHIWRSDPIVALVGSCLVVAGGAFDFEDDASAVEIRDVSDLDGSRWEVCESMPAVFEERAAATWLAVAVSDRKMYVLERNSGWFGSFDPEAKRWGPVSQLRPDPAIFLSAIGLSGNRLILVGATGNATHVQGIGIWEVDLVNLRHTQLGTMPPGMVNKLMSEGSGLWSIGFSNIGDYGYIYNPAEPAEVFLCDFGEGRCKWEVIRSPGVAVEHHPMLNIAFSCSRVGMDKLSKLVV